MATKTVQYRFRCVTEDCNVFVWKADTDPTPDKCPNNTEHTVDLTGLAIVDSVQSQDVNIDGVTTGVTLPQQEKGFQDLTGRNLYRFGDLLYEAQAGKTNIWMEKFSTTMWIQGGGVLIPEYDYVNGVEVKNKPERGDWCKFDLVDVDNVIGIGKKAAITKVARSGNVVTLTTSAAHNFVEGEVCCINVDDDTFDDMEEAIASVPDNTHINYANTGDDVAEKDATGTIGKIIVLAPFVPMDHVSPKKDWVLQCRDAKGFPSGVYVRFRYVSLGATNVIVMPHYLLRT